MISIRGDLDVDSVASLRHDVEGAVDGARALVVTIEPAAFVDSVGLGFLVSLRKRIGRSFAVVAPAHATVRAVLRTTGLIDFLGVREDVDGGVTSVSAEKDPANASGS